MFGQRFNNAGAYVGGQSRFFSTLPGPEPSAEVAARMTSITSELFQPDVILERSAENQRTWSQVPQFVSGQGGVVEFHSWRCGDARLYLGRRPTRE